MAAPNDMHLDACFESLDAAFALYLWVLLGNLLSVVRASELQFPMRQPWERILSHLPIELTALLADRTERTSGGDAFWLGLYSNTSTRCEWPALIAMPLTSAAPAGCCPELTPLQFPSGESQIFL